MRDLRCCFGQVVLGFWTLEGTLFVWSFPRVRCFVLIFSVFGCGVLFLGWFFE
jgi:hypothetical protein